MTEERLFAPSPLFSPQHGPHHSAVSMRPYEIAVNRHESYFLREPAAQLSPP
jgi:hypothetical protein